MSSNAILKGLGKRSRLIPSRTLPPWPSPQTPDLASMNESERSLSTFIPVLKAKKLAQTQFDEGRLRSAQASFRQVPS